MEEVLESREDVLPDILFVCVCDRRLGSSMLSWRSMGPTRASKLPLVGDC